MVAIILIIAAIAIPNLLRARIAANESSAASGIRTINTAQVSYNSTYPGTGYANTLLSLGPGGVAAACPTPPVAATSCLIDGVLANGAKGGYTYGYTKTVGGAINTGYQVAAKPTTANSTGVRSFCSFEDAVVRVDPTGALAATCPAATTPI